MAATGSDPGVRHDSRNVLVREDDVERQMAVSNILGTNCLEVALFFLADAVYRDGPILREADTSALFAAAIGMVVTAIFLLGLLERRDRTILGMGMGSAGVLLAYALGIVGLYSLR
jgi:cation:H+ antiporter